MASFCVEDQLREEKFEIERQKGLNRHAGVRDILACTYELFEDTLVERLFWLPAPVKLLVVLFQTLEVGFPLLTAVVAQLLDPVWSISKSGFKRREGCG